MNAWKITFATLVIFVAGVVTGGLLVNLGWRASDSKPGKLHVETTSPTSNQHTNVVRPNRLPAPMPGPLRKDFIERLGRELEMTDAQRARIEAIIHEGQTELTELWWEIEPDVHEALVDTKERIRAELSPEQKEKFELLLKPKTRNKQAAPAEATPAK